MPICELCGKRVVKGVETRLGNEPPHQFDCFECAIHAVERSPDRRLERGNPGAGDPRILLLIRSLRRSPLAGAA
ncbi:MAG TPA: hypothetical protein VGR67_14090 [Candidatus Polarisedimenticolia bacterium]|jgi:hypothetical protein|nr:hypothetical protein [Candidatus Polarisedimenticolia bacterium]